jgi:hypothetical protein
MKMKTIFSFAIFVFLLTNSTFGQRNCGAMDVLEQQLKENPQMLKNMEEIEKQIQEYIRKNPNGSGQRVVITIPTVVHVLYRTTSENISDAQIQSQINVLNQDFSATNTDIGSVPSLFSGVVSNVEVQFCLATQDPSGAATTGITRKSTTKTTWGTNDAVKKSSQGGTDPWNAANYLNIWVCNIGGGILGYAQFPGGPAATDGIVLDFRYTGTIGTATAPFNKGRTATHEVGHWLNLRHIWGDATCGSDFVNDTPVHNTSNGGCPAHPHYSTCAGAPVEMTMNYMDYTDDACMYMFSTGQKARMRAVLEGSGSRASLQTSPGCMPPSGGGSCNAPTNLSISNITASSASASWTAVSGAVNYTFEFKANSATTWTTASITGTGANMTGLSAATTYNTRVRTNCSGLSSSYSAVVNFTTSAGTTSCPDNYESNNTKNTSATAPLGTTITARISSTTDVDWFKFSSSSSQRNVQVTMTNLPADYDMELYRNNTFIMLSENDALNDELVKHNTTQNSATYYVKVYGFDGANSSSCYTLLAQRSANAFRSIGDAEDVMGEPIQDEFLVFPNPASSEISLVVPLGKNSDGLLTISDITGKQMISQNLYGDQNTHTYNMDVSAFKNGIYLIHFQSGEKVYTQKLIIAERK